MFSFISVYLELYNFSIIHDESTNEIFYIIVFLQSLPNIMGILQLQPISIRPGTFSVLNLHIWQIVAVLDSKDIKY